MVTTWGAGDYPLMAERLIEASAAVIEWADPGPGDHLLDIATGTGNAALLAAARGAEVIGIDFEPRLLDVARERSAQQGLAVTWRGADALDTGVPDGWASVVTSVFGIMFVADHAAAAREMARCASSGARVVLASWQPGSFIPAMGATLAGFLPPAPAAPAPPSRWGDPFELDMILSSAGLALDSHETRELTLTFVDPRDAVDFLERTAGHLAAAKPALMESGRWDALHSALMALVIDRGRLDHGGFELRGQYLLARATKP